MLEDYTTLGLILMLIIAVAVILMFLGVSTDLFGAKIVTVK